MNNEISSTTIEILAVRTDMRAGKYWQYVPGLTRNNKVYSCPAACPTGWDTTTQNMNKSGGDCGCN